MRNFITSWSYLFFRNPLSLIDNSDSGRCVMFSSENPVCNCTPIAHEWGWQVPEQARFFFCFAYSRTFTFPSALLTNNRITARSNRAQPEVQKVTLFLQSRPELDSIDGFLLICINHCSTNNWGKFHVHFTGMYQRPATFQDPILSLPV